MKILSITSNDLGISWGPAIHYLELWNEVVKHSNFEVTGISPSWTKKNNIVETNFHVKKLPIPNIRGIRQVIYDFKVTKYLIFNSRKFDFLYIRLSHWHILQILFLKLTKKAFIIELNGLSKEDSKSSKKSKITSRLIESQERWLVTNAKLNICVSDGIESTVKKRFKKAKTVTIGNGVATRFFKNKLPKPIQSKLKVGYVGTFTAWDGAGRIPELAKSFPHIKFLMVGDGDLRKDIQKRSPENVIFMGKLAYHDLPDFYSGINAGIVLYEVERHKNVKVSSLKTLEYVASKLPVFSTNINGQQFIQKNNFGLLHDELDDISDSFRKFINNLDVYSQSYEAFPHDLSDSFGWKKTAIETIKAIKNL